MPPFATVMAALQPPLPLAVAFSGGADSTALLVACARKWPGQVSAIHVHHGLQAAADDFEQACRTMCAQLQVPLSVVRVDARNAPGESPEDAARKARYTSLAQAALAIGVKTVLVAQHADDQVETMLLALSRGAGLPGLAAMPARFERGGMQFERPLLGVSAAEIRAWLAQEGIAFVEDPTNTDTSFTRNRIRRELLPAIERAFPQFRETFARSAQHAAHAQRVLTQFAEQDMASMQGDPEIAALQRLSHERQANVLRHWLRQAHGESASTAQLGELLAQVADCTTRGHHLRIKVGRGFVQREGGRLRFVTG